MVALAAAYGDIPIVFEPAEKALDQVTPLRCCGRILRQFDLGGYNDFDAAPAAGLMRLAEQKTEISQVGRVRQALPCGSRLPS